MRMVDAFYGFRLRFAFFCEYFVLTRHLRNVRWKSIEAVNVNRFLGIVYRYNIYINSNNVSMRSLYAWCRSRPWIFTSWFVTAHAFAVMTSMSLPEIQRSTRDSFRISTLNCQTKLFQINYWYWSFQTISWYQYSTFVWWAVNRRDNHCSRNIVFMTKLNLPMTQIDCVYWIRNENVICHPRKWSTNPTNSVARCEMQNSLVLNGCALA